MSEGWPRGVDGRQHSSRAVSIWDQGTQLTVWSDCGAATLITAEASFYMATRIKELGKTTCPPIKRAVSLRSALAWAQRLLSPGTQLGWLEGKHGGRKLPKMDSDTRGRSCCSGPTGPQHCLPNETAAIRKASERLGSQAGSHSSVRAARDAARDVIQKHRIIPDGLTRGDVCNWVLLVYMLAV